MPLISPGAGLQSLIWASVCCCALALPCSAAETFALRLREQVEVEPGAKRYHRLEREVSWNAAETLIIVCDMWDAHHCYRAVQREKEFAPRLNELLKTARADGAVILHAPSGCMAAYADHPSRKRIQSLPSVSDYPAEIANWCYRIPAEEAAEYPIDQTDGGEDDTPEEHRAWEQELASQGRNVKTPWLKQIDLIEIDADRDFISDSGTEVWNLIKNHSIKHVILAGVHTNMCVLGRPFGLRRMKLAGMDVALLRDMTDTMYNPAAKPFVSHFSGTDLIIDHIERLVCPTISSDQFLGGTEFRFKDDRRRHLALLINEPEYQTEQTLPKFVERQLRKDHRISYVYGDQANPNEFPGIAQITDADALLVSVRRRTPPPEQLDVLRKFIDRGKPVVGIRTASHAFSLRNQGPPPGLSEWRTFDADVFGGNYTNHYGKEHPVSLKKVSNLSPFEGFGNTPHPTRSLGSLYMVSPVHSQASVLLLGKIEGKPEEPVAWTFSRRDGGRSFYTSLGAPADFEDEAFQQFLKAAVDWALSGP